MKVLFWFAPLLLSSCATQTQTKIRPELAGVYRAERSIEGALAVGVSYPEFGTLVRQFSTELLLARDQARFSPPAYDVTRVLNKYEDLLGMYKDSSTVWGFEIEHASVHTDAHDRYLSMIAEKYGVSQAIRQEPKAIGSYRYVETTADYETIRQAIWAQAAKLHEQEIAIVYGYPVERVKSK